MADVAHKDDSIHDVIQTYWDEIDKDPQVQKRRAALEKAEDEGRTPDDAIYPNDYIASRGL